MKKKISNIIIVLITFSIVYLIYRSQYNIKNNNLSIEKGIEEFINEEITIQKMENLGKDKVVLFTLDNKEAIGITMLYKGKNGLYEVQNANYENKSSPSISTYEVKKEGKNYVLTYGQNIDKRINEVQVIYENKGKYTFKTQKDSYFINIANIEGDKLPTFKVYDKEKKDITEEITKEYYYEQQWGTGVGKTELFMVKIYIGVALLFGVIILNSNNKKKINKRAS